MGYLLIILFAFWNGFVIRWKQRNSKLDSKKWHSIGWWARVSVLMLMFPGIMPDWYIYLINPATLLPSSVQAGVLTFLLVFGLSYWGYNYIINKVNGWDWDYLEDEKNRKIYKILLAVWAALTIAWTLWGDNLIINIIQYRN